LLLHVGIDIYVPSVRCFQILSSVNRRIICYYVTSSISIVTDGSITPDDALAQAANQLIELFQPLATVTLVEEPGVEPEPSAEAQIPLEELNLSVRAYNCLKRAQVNSVSDLMGFSYEDLLEIKNFGSKSADEVIEALERIGISIPQSRTTA
jgi:DNA-directed RNA polymerase subunit alpha